MNNSQILHTTNGLAEFNLNGSQLETDRMNRRLAFSVQETADILGVSHKTVRRLINRKLLRASRALRHLLIPKKEIERFLDETTIK